MEYAIYLDSLGDKIKRVDNVLLKNKKISRLYFGEEFCEELIPDLTEVNKTIEYAKVNKLDYTYVCGYLTGKGYNKQVKILDYLNRKTVNEKKIEVTINDWGILSLISQRFKNLIPILGRLLVKNSRMPRYAKNIPIPYTQLVMNPKLWDNQLKVLRDSNLSVSGYRRFLKKHRIKRVECDIVPQGISVDRKLGFKFSFYTPWSYVTGARTCSLADTGHLNRPRLVRQEACSKPCRNVLMRLDGGAEILPMVQRGNAIFFDNSSLANAFMNQTVFDRVILENLFI